MVFGIFGESCTGKSTLADKIEKQIGGEIFTGKDYLRLAKNEGVAKKLFEKKMQDAVDSHIIYVIAEKKQLPLLPENAVRILVTAELPVIKERFAQRMHGNLPAPVEKMLETKHGCFDAEAHHIHVISGETDLDAVCSQIQGMLRLV